jgi:hypothetical protein
MHCQVAQHIDVSGVSGNIGMRKCVAICDLRWTGDIKYHHCPLCGAEIIG